MHIMILDLFAWRQDTGNKHKQAILRHKKNCDFLNCLLVLVSCVKKGKNQTVERINLSVVRVHEK